MNIGIVNEMKIVAKMNININEVINAASTKPFGFLPTSLGQGWGTLYSVDPYYLMESKKEGVSTKLLDTANKVNGKMPYYIAKETIKLLNKEKKNYSDMSVLSLAWLIRRISMIQEVTWFGILYFYLIKKYE